MVPRLGLALSLLLLAGCGSSTITSSSSSSNSLLDPFQVRDPAPVVNVTTSGVTPQVSHLDRGVPVRIVNQDTVAHRLVAAPELAYGPCPEVEQLASLAPGESLTVTIARNGTICAYKDEARGSAFAFQGLLVVH